ncbi:MULTISPECIES: hypothetical protein [Xenorhabdus]|uniref:hypothetical protein n=1 Tax=Xenorhabdus TaxID=626 RepID=UPI000C04CD65|nr:hypothetical protein [Xenorhabdus sp. KK7.4]PHM52085.1 hypothetical protein Xekk_03310 [Xenorhabdus sp. KK7.4]
MIKGLDIDGTRVLLNRIQSNVNDLLQMCDTIEGSPNNGTELPEAVTALCQTLIPIETHITTVWDLLFGSASTIVKNYFLATKEPDMAVVYNFILINAPHLTSRLR